MKQLLTLSATVALLAVAVVFIQREAMYFPKGVRVEYAGDDLREIDMVSQYSDVHAVYIKKIGTPLAMSLVSQPDNFGGDLQETTYRFPSGTAFSSVTIWRQPDGSLLLMHVTTRRGVSIPIFDGLPLGDGTYSVSSLDMISSEDMFTVKDGSIYLGTMK